MFGYFLTSGALIIYIGILIFVFWFGFKFINAMESISKSVKELVEILKEKK